MRCMASAILKACASDSMTQGPAMRKSRPEPTSTGPISNELLTREIVQATVDGERWTVNGAANGKRRGGRTVSRTLSQPPVTSA